MPTCDLTLAMDVFGEVDDLPDPIPRHLHEIMSLADDLIIGRVTADTEAIIDACDPQGINWHRPHRAFGSQYGIARLARPGHSYQFDPDLRLRTCVQLSRVAHPTALSFIFAGRLTTDNDGAIVEFSPARLLGGGRHAFVADPAHNWLDDDHVAVLRQLLASFSPDVLPQRVLNALFYHEYVHQLQTFDARWPMATTGLESLVHTDRHGSTRQFVERLLGLQATLGLVLANEGDLLAIYDRRSTLAHGQTLGGMTPENKRLYELLELVLRTTIKNAILNSVFGDLFRDDVTIRATWPV